MLTDVPSTPTTTSSHPLTGREVVLRHGAYTASVVTLGASLRSLEHDGRPLVVAFHADRMRPAYRGTLLAPWPNRVVDGRYTFDGEDQQLPLTEPERGHALHGLLVWADWQVTALAEDSVTLTAELAPSAGYPHRLVVEGTYALDDDGLTTTVTARSLSGRAPYGTSAHPYLTAGGASLDATVLTLPADRYVETAGERLLPAGERDVTDAPWPDFRTPTAIGDAMVDHAFTGLARAADGRARVRLEAPDGFAVEMTWGPELGWVQVHTADRPEPELNRVGLAVEPMTCPPDAFSTGEDVVVLDGVQEHTASWTISAG
ncbi:aldose 1-epimerase family protein [Microlunatus spumicola]|uniref:Aldose 1-epimerase family protein n=1 Tax=Microlunatus spumicola TaxID=81499 RepID=A0ABP6XMK0_9ACTN